MEENNQTTPTPVDQTNSSMNMSETHSSNTHKHHNHGNHPVMAGFWSRFFAYFLDGLVIGAVTAPVNFVIGFARGSAGAVAQNMNPTYGANDAVFGMMAGLAGLSSILSFGITLLLAYFYFGYFYSTKGQTPGKMLLKLKVVKASDLSYLDWNTAFIRDGLMKIVSSFLVYLGFFWYFATPKRQTWHDLVAKSYVVQTDDNGNILMNGPESYPASKAKAFAFPCGCCLFYLLMIVGGIFAVGALAPQIRNAGEANPALREAAKEMQRMQEQNGQSQEYQNFMNSLEGEYNGSESGESSSIDEINQQQMQMLQQMQQEQMDQMMENYKYTPESN